MRKMKGKDLVAFCRSKLGTPYVYGTKGEILTQQKYTMLKRMYGDYIWNSDVKKVGKVCVDCSGLISWACGVVRGSSQWMANATDKHPISTIKNAPIGALVWMKGHIGVYTGVKGGVPYYIAADGSAYGVREVPLSKNKFTHWLLDKNVFDYSTAKTEHKEEKEEEDMVKYYEKLQEVPTWAKPMVQDMVEKGCFADKNKLHLSEDMLRTMALWDRYKK